MIRSTTKEKLDALKRAKEKLWGSLIYGDVCASIRQLQETPVPTYTIECHYKDTCLSDYLTDHHNGNNELLIGISPHGQSKDEASRELLREADLFDKIPAEIGNAELKAAFLSALAGVDLRWIDAEGNRHREEPQEDNEEEGAYVWFVLTWKEE